MPEHSISQESLVFKTPSTMLWYLTIFFNFNFHVSNLCTVNVMFALAFVWSSSLSYSIDSHTPLKYSSSVDDCGPEKIILTLSAILESCLNVFSEYCPPVVIS